MTKAGKLIKEIETGIQHFFNGDAKTQEIINGVCNLILKAQTLVNSNITLILAKEIPNGIGTITLDGIRALINKAVPDIEVAQRASEQIATATKGMTDPGQLAATIIPILIQNINTLPANQQGKHIEEICVAMLSKVLTINIDELKLLVTAVILKIKQETQIVTTSAT